MHKIFLLSIIKFGKKFRYHQTKEDVLNEMNKVNEILDEEIINEKFNNNCCPDIRKKVWDVMENPNTSSLAKVIQYYTKYLSLLIFISFI